MVTTGICYTEQTEVCWGQKVQEIILLQGCNHIFLILWNMNVIILELTIEKVLLVDY